MTIVMIIIIIIIIVCISIIVIITIIIAIIIIITIIIKCGYSWRLGEKTLLWRELRGTRGMRVVGKNWFDRVVGCVAHWGSRWGCRGVAGGPSWSSGITWDDGRDPGRIPFEDHPLNLERYREDLHGPCARMRHAQIERCKQHMMEGS